MREPLQMCASNGARDNSSLENQRIRKTVGRFRAARETSAAGDRHHLSYLKEGVKQEPRTYTICQLAEKLGSVCKPLEGEANGAENLGFNR